MSQVIELHDDLADLRAALDRAEDIHEVIAVWRRCQAMIRSDCRQHRRYRDFIFRKRLWEFRHRDCEGTLGAVLLWMMFTGRRHTAGADRGLPKLASFGVHSDLLWRFQRQVKVLLGDSVCDLADADDIDGVRAVMARAWRCEPGAEFVPRVEMMTTKWKRDRRTGTMRRQRFAKSS